MLEKSRFLAKMEQTQEKEVREAIEGIKEQEQNDSA